MAAPFEDQTTWLRTDARARATSLLVCPRCCGIFRTERTRCPFDGVALERTDEDPVPGTLLDRDFAAIGLIGTGAMGRVYRGVDLRHQRPVALKLLYADLAAAPAMRRRFALEGVLGTTIDHPNVVRAFCHRQIGHRSFIAMELVAGETLDAHLARRGALPPAEVIALVRSLLDGLEAIHRAGVVHRDVKPGNVMLEPTVQGLLARITDLGVAQRMDAASGLGRRTGVVGSPSFMAPEQARGEPCDERTDLYALGVTLHCLLSGNPPFESTPEQILYAKATEPVTLPPLPEADPFLVRLRDRLTAPRPEDRPDSAAATRELLRRRERRTWFGRGWTPRPGARSGAGRARAM